MNPNKFYEAEWLKNRNEETVKANMAYRERHPEFKRLDFPNNFYFKIIHDRQQIHWAIIVKEEKYSVYFIRINGQAFDKLEFETYNKAKRQLRKNKFLCHSNARCPYLPVSPIFVNLGAGRKSAPYSKGNLWGEQNVRPRKKLCVNKQKQNSLLKELFLFFLRYIGCIIFLYVYMKVIGWV